MKTVKSLSTIQDLLSELKANRNIIIYGYKGIGESVLDLLMHNYYRMRSSEYNGQVKYFATSYDNYEVREGIKEVKGIPIKPIWELKNYAKTALVIVATREKDQNDVLEKLEQYGFEMVVTISKELYTKLKMENKKITGELRLEVMNYSLNHQNKLELLREKVANGHKVKVLFLTQRATIFGCKSIYEEMLKSDLFDPYVLVFSKTDRISEDYKKEVTEDYRFFKDKGYKVLSIYDNDDYLVDLDSYNPDIIFYDCPNLHSYAKTGNMRNDMLNWKYLTCYVPYGLYMANSFYYHYENINLREVWKYFLDTKYSYKRSLSEADFNGGNAVLAGYPKLDDYFAKKEELNIPKKINNGRKIVIYAPHWSIDVSNRYSTFHKYYKYFFQLAKDNPDINFVFKPHPQLGYRIKAIGSKDSTKMITYDEYLKYVKEWDNLPNGICITEGDYIDLFKASSCLITDSGSFIGEYLLSGHPCVYLLNTDKENPIDGYSDVAKKILDKYYLCNNLNEIEKTVKDVVFENKDYKKEERNYIAQAEFYNIGKAGQFICDYLEKQIKGE